jgi:hypothetical protein
MTQTELVRAWIPTVHYFSGRLYWKAGNFDVFIHRLLLGCDEKVNLMSKSFKTRLTEQFGIKSCPSFQTFPPLRLMDWEMHFDD